MVDISAMLLQPYTEDLSLICELFHVVQILVGTNTFALLDPLFIWFDSLMMTDRSPYSKLNRI